jgi:hypothetical protein
MKNVFSWDATPCCSCKNRRIGATYRLHYQGQKNQRTRNKVSKAMRRLLQEPHSVASQKTALFMSTDCSSFRAFQIMTTGFIVIIRSICFKYDVKLSVLGIPYVEVEIKSLAARYLNKLPAHNSDQVRQLNNPLTARRRLKRQWPTDLSLA